MKEVFGLVWFLAGEVQKIVDRIPAGLALWIVCGWWVTVSIEAYVPLRLRDKLTLYLMWPLALISFIVVAAMGGRRRDAVR